MNPAQQNAHRQIESALSHLNPVERHEVIEAVIHRVPVVDSPPAPSQRKYTLDEIDRMRRAVADSYTSGMPYLPKERNADVENRLRTYMSNGTSPEELEQYAAKAMKAGSYGMRHSAT